MTKIEEIVYTVKQTKLIVMSSLSRLFVVVVVFLTVFPFKMSLAAPLCTNAWAPPLYANKRDVAGSRRPVPPPLL